MSITVTLRVLRLVLEFNFVNSFEIEMLENELFEHLTVCKQMTDVQLNC